ncbi:MAG: porin family protein [Vicinamibacterales bacterium]
MIGVSVPAFAQSKIGGGVKAGVNFSTVTGDIDDGVSKSMRTGGAVGGFISMPLTDRVTFEPEILYSMEGVKLEITEAGTTLESTAKVGVVQIPFLFRFAMPSSGKVSGYVVAGPAVGVLASAKQTNPLGGGDEDIKDQLKSADFSLVVGAGVNIQRFLVEARYSAGLTDVNKEDTGSKNRLQVFSILLGVRF